MDFNLEEVQSENTGFKSLSTGLDIPAILESVGFAKDQNDETTEDLVFAFKGIATGNTGNFNFRIWGNKFDTTNDRFDKRQADWSIAQIKHILNAYLPETVTSKIGGSSWIEFAKNISKALQGDVIKPPCKLKIIYDNKNRESFPLFPDFIRTKMTPERKLVLNVKINPKTNRPYESITPIVISAPADTAVGTGFGAAGLPPIDNSDDVF